MKANLILEKPHGWPRSTIVAKAESCSSCGVRLVDRGSTTFACPQCAETVIGRCKQCRDQSVTFSCAKCGFVGP
ncbi:MAG: DUF1610 domain-containing protein [Euryarchaeota archaeon]|nr:DUF1610 domain-containing protein [Euryarchaeota archaeon]